MLAFLFNTSAFRVWVAFLFLDYHFSSTHRFDVFLEFKVQTSLLNPPIPTNYSRFGFTVLVCLN